MAVDSNVDAASSGTPTGGPGSGGARRRGAQAARAAITGPAAVAIVTAAIAGPLLYAVPGRLDLDPFGPRNEALAVATFLALAAVLLVLTRWRSGERVAAVAAGLLAAWMALSTRAALHGTPYGALGLEGDANRMAAMANRFSLTAASADAWHQGLPQEYPPLYPWLVGRVSALTGVAAWRLLDNAQIIAVALAVLVAFLLWRRWFAGWTALVIAGVAVLSLSRLDKTFELLALVCFVPWALDCLARPPRARLPWALSGLLAGLLVLLYWGWFMFASLGLAVLAVRTWRASAQRWAYTRYLLAVAAVAVVVSSWFTLPYLAGLVSIGGTAVSDLYEPPGGLVADLLPVLDPTPFGLVQLVGLVGLLALRRTTWWATPLLILTAGVFAFRVLATSWYVLTGHTLALHYTPRLYSALLAVAGVLTIAHALPALVARWRRDTNADTRLAAAVGVALLLSWTAYDLNHTWMPRGENPTAKAYLEPLPEGGYVAAAPADGRVPWFPTGPIATALAREWGPSGDRVLLSASEKIYPFVPWYGYISVGPFSANSMSHRPQRLDEVRRLTTIADPDALADAAAATAFGPIDAFILYDRTDGPAGPGWYFSSQRFVPGQFASARWHVMPMPAGVVLIVRR
jgi:hypothetical protein